MAERGEKVQTHDSEIEVTSAKRWQEIGKIYVRNFGNYNLIYGSLAVVVILVLWAWISALILLLGGEVAAHIQEIMIEGKPADAVEQRHKKPSPTHPES